MKKLVSTTNLTHEEWLRYRKTGIGGSDAGAICGLNPYVSPMSVYFDKTSEDIQDFENEAMRQGRDLEEYVARRFTEETGFKVRRTNAIYQNTAYPFMLANVDRLLVGEHMGLECKTTSAYNADKWADGLIPSHYEIQCHHYMAITGAAAWYLVVVIFGRGFKIVKIDRDEEIIRNLITVEEEFWNKHVTKRIMPEPDGSGISDEIITRYFPVVRKKEIILPPGFNEALKRREDITGLISKLEREQRQIEQEIKLFMGEHEAASNKHYRITWSNVDTVRIDSKRLKQEMPELYQSFSKCSQSRRFTIKEA